MKRTVIFVICLLLCTGAGIVIGQQTKVSPKEEKHEEREKKRADRIAAYEKFIDSLVLSHNFQFNPQTMQREPAGRLRQLNHPEFQLGYWDNTMDICLPYIKGYTPPYYVTVMNYTVPNVAPVVTTQTHEGWKVVFKSSLYTSDTYTFTLDVSSRTGSATLTISNPSYSDVEYDGSITQLY